MTNGRQAGDELLVLQVRIQHHAMMANQRGRVQKHAEHGDDGWPPAQMHTHYSFTSAPLLGQKNATCAMRAVGPPALGPLATLCVRAREARAGMLADELWS